MDRGEANIPNQGEIASDHDEMVSDHDMPGDHGRNGAYQEEHVLDFHTDENSDQEVTLTIYYTKYILNKLKVNSSFSSPILQNQTKTHYIPCQRNGYSISSNIMYQLRHAILFGNWHLNMSHWYSATGGKRSLVSYNNAKSYMTITALLSTWNLLTETKKTIQSSSMKGRPHL